MGSRRVGCCCRLRGARRIPHAELSFSRKDATNRMRRIPPSIPALVFHSFLRALMTRRPPANLPYRFFYPYLYFFFLTLLGQEEKSPGYLLSGVISVGAPRGKVGVRISQRKVLAEGEVGGVAQSAPDLYVGDIFSVLRSDLF